MGEGKNTCSRAYCPKLKGEGVKKVRLDLVSCQRNAERLTEAFRHAGLNVTVTYEKKKHPAGNLCNLKTDGVLPEVRLFIGGGSRVVIEDIKPGYALVQLYYRVEYTTNLIFFRDKIKVLFSAAPANGVRVHRVPWETATVDEAIAFTQKYAFKRFWEAAGRERYRKIPPYEALA